MSENTTRRKLTAILCADVKGYSKLMGEDESYTVVTLKEYRQVFAENIQSNGGRVVNAPGDSILAEFPSVVSAVQCAVEIQNQLNDRNAELPDNRKMAFRIGVNLGDVIQSEDAIYGDGVNIAARIESLAEPGGVSISRTVFNQVHNKLPYGYEYQGEHQVKNITKPVKVYKLLTAPEDAGKVVRMEPTVSASKWIWPTALVAAVIVTLIGYQVYQEIAGPKFEPVSIEKMAYDLPDKPSIAVLPFDNMSGDPHQEYLCDGLSEQIITSLSKVSGLFVIARNSSFSFKGKSIKVQQVAQELGVRYVLEGSLQKSGDKVRITAQLIDAITGHHLWAETYDRELQDIFSLQDEITIKILGSVGAELTKGERARIHTKGTDNLDAYIKVSKGFEHFERQGKEENILARKFAKEAIDLDPNYPGAWNLLGGTYLMDPWVGSTDSTNPWDEAIKALQKALALDETFAPSHGGLAMIYGFQKKYEKAFAQAQKGIDLNPGFPIMHLGYVLVFVGKYEEAVQYFQKAIRHDPKAPTFYYLGLGHAYRGLEQYEDAIAAYKKALEREPDYLMGHIFLTSAYYLAGREAEARAEVAEVLRLQPEYSVARLVKLLPYQDKNFYNRTLESIRKAGLPENPPKKLPEKPSIAVLPFDNMSGDPDQTYFSDGISEDLITDLSKISGLLVISRMSSFSYKGKKLKVQQIAKELGVRYVLEGSVRKAESRVRINAQLIDASSGHHVWAERYDGNMEDIFTLQDNINRKIISALALKLTSSEQQNITDKGTNNLQAYDEFLKGWQGYRQLTKAGFAEAKIRLEKAIELDPEFARAYAALAVLYWKATHFAAPEHREGLGLTTRQKLLAVKAKPQFLVKKAMKKPTALAHGLMSQFYLMRYQHDEALVEIERALAMDPNDPELYAWMSEILWLMGKSSEAIESATMGLRLDPNNPATYLRQLGRSYLPDGDLKKSLQLFERAKRLNPELSGTVAFHQSVIYGIQGNIEEARNAYEIFIESRMYPVRNLSSILNYFPFADPKNLDRIADALVNAGAPGNPTDYYRILKENRINGQAVKSLLFGRKIFGVAMSTGKPIEWEWADNGEFKFTMGKFQTKGNSWVDGDVFFVQFEKIFGGLPYGWVFYRNPDGSSESKDQYLMVSDIGTMNHFALAD